MSRTIRKETRELLQHSQQAQPVLITEVPLAGLPEPVQRYLRTVRLKQQGSLLKNSFAKLISKGRRMVS